MPRYFPATLCSLKGYEDIAACVTYMGNAEGSPFGLDSYVQIAACVTYRLQSGLLAPFSDRSRVAPHVVGMLLTVAALVIGTRFRKFPFGAHPQVRRENRKGHASCVSGEVCTNSVISKIKKLKKTLDTAGVVRDGR